MNEYYSLTFKYSSAILKMSSEEEIFMTRVTKEPAQRRQEILDTAMKLFYEKGYEKTSITDIAKAMGVAQGLCYRYFSSKEEIFDTAIDKYAEVLTNKMKSSVNFDMPLKEMIFNMSTFKDVETDDNFYYKVCHGTEKKKIHYQLSMKICEKMMPYATAIAEKAVETKVIKPINTKSLASYMIYGQLGILLDDTLTADEKLENIKEMLNRLLNI